MQTEAPRKPRYSRRFRSCCLETVVVASGGDLSGGGWVRFITDHGLILESDRLFEEGTELLLRIDPEAEFGGVPVTVHVMEVNRLGAYKWGLSCRFPQPVNAASLKALLG